MPKSRSRFRLTVEQYASVLGFFIFGVVMTVGRTYGSELIQFGALVAIAVCLAFAVHAELQLRKSPEPVTIREKRVALASQIIFTFFCVSGLLVAAFLAKTHEASLKFIGSALVFVVAIFFVLRRWRRENLSATSKNKKDALHT
jgi:hypothetical protein